MKEDLRFIYKFRFMLLGYMFLFMDNLFLNSYIINDYIVAYVYTFIVSLTTLDFIPNFSEFSMLKKTITILITFICFTIISSILFLLYYLFCMI